MLYSGTDEFGNTTELRMPSRTAIAPFSKDNHHPTFDVPVHVAVNGQVRQCRVRVAAGVDGRWTTQAVGSPLTKTRTWLRRSTRSSSPPVSTALTGVNLMARRAERIRALGTAQHPVDSSWDGTGLAVMTTKTKPGAPYGYTMDAAMSARFVAGPKPGRFFNQHVRGSTVRLEVSQCGRCGR